MSKPDAVDYSWGRPDPRQLARAGIKLVSRYLSHDDSKDISATEARALHSAGIGVLLNWESHPGRPLGGSVTGAQDGHDAAAKADAIGAPHGLTIYYSCDTDTQPGQWPLIADYYAAAGRATLGRYKVGVYGEADLIDYLHRQGVVTSEWQTYAWSNGRLSANADLFQYLNSQTLAGAAVDFDRIIHPDKLGAWWPKGSPYAAPPVAPKPPATVAAPVLSRKSRTGTDQTVQWTAVTGATGYTLIHTSGEVIWRGIARVHTVPRLTEDYSVRVVAMAGGKRLGKASNLVNIPHRGANY